MKRQFAALLLLLATTASCDTQPNAGTDEYGTPTEPATALTPAPTLAAQTALPELGQYTFDELLAAGEEGGCGMVMLAPNTNPYQDGIYFFRGIGRGSQAAPGYIEISDEIVALAQVSASGEEFYGQQTSQTFESENGAVTLQVDVTLGAAGEIESVDFAEGKLTLTSDGQSETYVAEGSAGC